MTCHRCGHVIEEGTAFCSNCGAPQIRVALPEEETATAATAEDTVHISPAARGAVEWSRAFLAAFVPAFVAVLLMELGPVFALGFPLWIGIAGYASVLFYRHRAPGAAITSAVGMRIGAITGLCCFGLTLLRIGISFLVVRASGHSVQKDLMDQVRHQMSANPNPEAARFAQEFLARPEAFAIMVTVSLVMLFVIVVVCATAGGAIAGAVQARRPRG